jgi:galactokinase
VRPQSPIRLATSLFQGAFATRPAVAASAPGRLFLLGDADAHREPAIAMAIDRRTAVVASRAWTWEAVSGRDSVVDPFDPEAPDASRWTDHLAEVVRGLRAHGVSIPGARLAVASSLPRRAGFGAAMALRIAAARVLCLLAGRRVSEVELVSAVCGPPPGKRGAGQWRDASAIALAKRGAVMWLDPIGELAGLHSSNIQLTVVETGARLPPLSPQSSVLSPDSQALSLLSQNGLSLARLGDLEPAALPAVLAWLPPPLHRVVTRVVAESDRVRRLVRDGIVSARLGNLWGEDSEPPASGEEIECLLSSARSHGALGVREVGRPGWGVVLLLPPEGAGAARIEAMVAEDFRHAFGRIPTLWRASPAAGVQSESLRAGAGGSDQDASAR